MKSPLLHRMRGGLLIAAALAITVAVSAPAAPPSNVVTRTTSGNPVVEEQRSLAVDAGDAYQTRTGRRTLHRMAGAVSVQISPAASADGVITKLIAPDGPLAGYTRDPERLGAGNLAILKASPAERIRQRQDPRRVGETADKARRSAGVAGANPVFLDPQQGLWMAPTDRLMVRLQPGVDPQAYFGAEWPGVQPMAGSTDVFFVSRPGSTAEQLFAEVDRRMTQPEVRWAEPEFISQVVSHVVPNDTYFNQQWFHELTTQTAQSGLAGADINSPAAWNFTTGSPGIIVAVVDGGIQLNHPDLNPNIATNRAEIAGNGIDDDHNGYIDDVNGWSFAAGQNTNNPSPIGAADNHGTPVAGVVAARGNNALGVAGVAYTSRILPVRVAGGPNGISATDFAAAIYYAGGVNAAGSNFWRGADVLNVSLGYPQFSVMDDAFEMVATRGRGGLGCPIFAATGNSDTVWKSRKFNVVNGAHTLRVEYVKNASGTDGADAVWLGQVALPGLQYETFTGAGLPPNWTTGGASAWARDTTPGVTMGAAPGALKSGPLGANQTNWIELKWTNTASILAEGFFTYRTSTAPGDEIRFYMDNSLFYSDSGNPPTAIGISYPASHPNVFAIGAVSDYNQRSDFSQFGANLFMVAPSGGGKAEIWTTDRTGTSGFATDPGVHPDYFDNFSGTSAASPIAAGVGALMLSANTNLNVLDLTQIFTDTCTDVGNEPYTAGRNQYFGHGRVDAGAAVAAAYSYVFLPPDTRIGRILGRTLSLPGLDFSVGTNGIYTALDIKHGGILTNNSVAIGANGSANFNLVYATDPGTRWVTLGALKVGVAGSFNRFDADGGAYARAGNLVIGSIGGSNEVNITSAGTQVAVQSAVTLGDFGSGGNELNVGYGGRLDSVSASVGRNSNRNAASVIGGDARWVNTGDINVGESTSADNRIVVDNLGRLDVRSIIVTTGNGGRNSLTVQGGGSVIGGNALYIGLGGGSSNLLTVLGGSLAQFGGDVTIGFNSASRGNRALVQGAGARLIAGGVMFVGSGSAGNSIIVTNGGSVTASNLWVGSLDPAATNNRVVIHGGTASYQRLQIAGGLLSLNAGSVTARQLIVTNPAATDFDFNGGTLRITNATVNLAGPFTAGNGISNALLHLAGSGTNRFHSGLVLPALSTLTLDAGMLTTASLTSTSATANLNFNGGTMILSNSLVANGAAFEVGDSNSPATLVLAGGSHRFANALVLTPNSRLTGDATVSGGVVARASSLIAPGLPGAVAGQLILSNTPALQGAIEMAISRNGAVLTNDRIVVRAPLTYGGSLVVSNTGPTALVAGDRFDLFDATSFGGIFSSVSLPTLAPGLFWLNRLTTDGSIEVATLTTRYWTNPAGGSYNVAGNWFQGLIPEADDTANFTNNANYAVTWPGNAAVANAAFDPTSGTVTQAVGAFNWFVTNRYSIGSVNGTTGRVLHASGGLRVTNTGRSALLDIVRGGLTLDGGTVEADTLSVASPGAGLAIRGGTLITRGAPSLPGFSIGTIPGAATATWEVRTGAVHNVGPLALGTGSTASRLLITGGGRMVASGGGFRDNGGVSNLFLVADPGSQFDIFGEFWIGQTAIAASLVVTNGGRAYGSGPLLVGHLAGADRNSVTVSGSNSLLSARARLAIGESGTSNRLVVARGARASTGDGSAPGTGLIQIGNLAGSSANAVTVADPGSILTGLDVLELGRGGSGNSLTVTNGGRVSNRGAQIGPGPTSGNRVTVTGAGSSWSNAGTLMIGQAGGNHRLEIANGAAVDSNDTFIGEGGSGGNQVSATDDASWAIRGQLTFGGGAPNNSLVVSNQAQLVISNHFVVGRDGLSVSNRVIVDDGNLRVGANPLNQGILDVRRGTFVLNDGFIDTVNLQTAPGSGFFEHNGGTLRLRNSLNAGSSAYTVGDGIRPATLQLQGTVSETLVAVDPPVTVNSNASLIGQGFAKSTWTTLPGSRLAPGVTNFGWMSFAVPPVLGGELVLKIGRNGATLSNDWVAVFGSGITFGGTLTITNTGSTPLAAGDRFQLISASSYSGAFTAVQLPNPGPGLAWQNSLAVDGSITVIPQGGPQFSSVTRNGANLVLTLTGGTPGATFDLLTSTNVTLPRASWTIEATSTFNGSGGATLNLPINTATPRRFFQTVTRP